MPHYLRSTLYSADLSTRFNPLFHSRDLDDGETSGTAELVEHYGANLWKPLEFPDALDGVVVKSQKELEESECR